MVSVLHLLVVLALLGQTAAPATPAPISAEELARRIEARHRSVRDLTARFVQTYRSGLLGREMVETGILSLKPPGRMRWEYREPEKKTFVSDGKNFYFYVPADRQVIVREQAGDARHHRRCCSPATADILREFTVAAGAVARRGAAAAPDAAAARPRGRARLLEVDDRRPHPRHPVRDAQGNREPVRSSRTSARTWACRTACSVSRYPAGWRWSPDEGVPARDGVAAGPGPGGLRVLAAPSGAGERAERRQDYDRAVLEYSQAVQPRPDNLTTARPVARPRCARPRPHAIAGAAPGRRGAATRKRSTSPPGPGPQPRRRRAVRGDEAAGGAAAGGAAAPRWTRSSERTRERALPGLALGPGGPRAARPVLPQRQPARGLPGAGQGGRRQLRLRPPVPGPADHPRPARTSRFEQALDALASVGHTFHRVVDARVVRWSRTRPPSGASTSSRW